MSSNTIVSEKRQYDVYKALEGQPTGTRFTREQTMEIMEQIFVSRLLIGMKPLQGFRELPYKWVHHKFPDNLSAPATRRQMFQYVDQSDLIWVLPGNELITARNEKRDKFQRPFVWVGKQHMEAVAMMLRNEKVVLLSETHYPKARPPIGPDSAPPGAPLAPFTTGMWVYAKSPPVETPEFHVSMGHGIISNRQPRRVAQIWWLHGRWMTSLVNEPGMFEASSFEID